jgi:prepilin-type N-terminal cleavage/methylation domain-containing protein
VRRAHAAKGGFSLIEALVALAIGAMVLGAILGLQHELVDAQRRHDATLKSSNLQRDVLALIRDVNPAERPDGEIALPPDRVIRWSSEAVSDAKLTAGFPRADGNYTATLYVLTVNVQDAGGRDVIAPFTVERVGWISAATVEAEE